MNLAYNLTHVDEIFSRWQQLVTANLPREALTFLVGLIDELTLVSDPGVSWLYCLQGETYTVVNQPREAARCYIRCLKIRPTSYKAWEGLIGAFERLGKNRWADNCVTGLRAHVSGHGLLIIQWQDFIKSGDYDSAKSIIAASRWNLIEEQSTTEVRAKRLRRDESIVWNYLEYMLGAAEAERISLMMQE